MPQRDLTIQNSLGLHLRPVAKLVAEARKFKSEVFISKDGLKVNGKSPMGIMMLAAAKDSVITIEAVGDDAEDALDALEDLVVRQKFDEE